MFLSCSYDETGRGVKHCGSHKQVCTMGAGAVRCIVPLIVGCAAQQCRPHYQQSQAKKGVPTPCQNSGAAEIWQGCGSVVSWFTVKTQVY